MESLTVHCSITLFKGLLFHGYCIKIKTIFLTVKHMKNKKYMRKGLYLCISNEVYSNLSNKTKNSMLHLININNQEF